MAVGWLLLHWLCSCRVCKCTEHSGQRAQILAGAAFYSIFLLHNDFYILSFSSDNRTPPLSLLLVPKYMSTSANASPSNSDSRYYNRSFSLRSSPAAIVARGSAKNTSPRPCVAIYLHLQLPPPPFVSTLLLKKRGSAIRKR